MTLLKLSGRALRAAGPTSSSPFVGRICERPDLPFAERTREILLSRAGGELPGGFRGYFLHEQHGEAGGSDSFWLAPEFRYLEDGDVVRVDPARGALAVLYRRQSSANTFLVTERCDNYCLMCSQPPRDIDDSHIVDELVNALPLISTETQQIGITGGEPGLLGPRLVELLEAMGRFLPRTSVHILSNGRRFAERSFARALADVRHPDVMVGVPLYSDLPEAHDYVVQARGAFDETLRGILNLKQAGVQVEIRFVIHGETYRRLPEFAEFVARNLVFADHVALMGLELMGFAKANLDTLWVDPLDYQTELLSAVRTLDRARVPVSIYNHQLCVLSPQLHPFARKSISDWKNMFLDECLRCAARPECGGFFASSKLRVSRGISATTSAPTDQGSA
jgi:His-Xaa-Ser system radical SAM maturase HxsC